MSADHLRALGVTLAVTALALWLVPTHLDIPLRHATPNLRSFVTRTIRLFIILLGTVMCFSILGFQTPAVALGVFVTVIGVTASSSAGTFFDGTLLLLSGPFQIGDAVTIYVPPAPLDGVVKDITLQHTVILNVAGDAVVIPNSTMKTLLIVRRGVSPQKRES